MPSITGECCRLRTPPQILVVDDDPTNLEVLRVRLNAQGFEVVIAVDGDDALRRARELEPDLILLDVMMPKIDGISVLKELKQDATLRYIPVILVTAKVDTCDIVSGLGQAAMTISQSHSSKRWWWPASARCCPSKHFTMPPNCKRRS